jgi:dCMP deaminase
MTWDKYFIEVACTVSKRAIKPFTQVGAVIVDQDNVIRATGYNGLPRGVDIRQDLLEEDNDLRYWWTCHAEQNAIWAAARVGVPLKDCKIYCTHMPCIDCAKGIVQTGLNTVIVDGQRYNKYRSYDPKVHEEFFKKFWGHLEVRYVY